MRETADELVEKYTRSELIDLARERGIYVSRSKNYPNKMSIAEAMVKAAPGKPKAMTMMKEPKAEGKGVFAKKAAIRMQKKTNKEAVSQFHVGVDDLRDDIDTATKNMENGIGMFHVSVNTMNENILDRVADINKRVMNMKKSIHEQRKTNNTAVRKMAVGVHSIKKDIGGMRKKMDNKVMDMNSGTDLIVGDIHSLMGEVTGFVKEFYYG